MISRRLIEKSEDQSKLVPNLNSSFLLYSLTIYGLRSTEPKILESQEIRGEMTEVFKILNGIEDKNSDESHNRDTRGYVTTYYN